MWGYGVDTQTWSWFNRKKTKMTKDTWKNRESGILTEKLKIREELIGSLLKSKFSLLSNKLKIAQTLKGILFRVIYFVCAWYILVHK